MHVLFCLEPDQEIVLLSQVLAHSCNIGYETQRNLVLANCNGEQIRSLKQLKQLIDSSAATCKSLVFESKSGSVIVLNREAAIAAQEQVDLVCFLCFRFIVKIIFLIIAAL